MWALVWSVCPECVCACLCAEMDRGFEVSDSQLQGQQRLSDDLPQETVSACLYYLDLAL